MSNTVHAEIPDKLWKQANVLVEQGWVGNMQEVMHEALRRYVESHQGVLTEPLIQEDVEWGLHGKD